MASFHKLIICIQFILVVICPDLSHLLVYITQSLSEKFFRLSTSFQDLASHKSVFLQYNYSSF